MRATSSSFASLALSVSIVGAPLCVGSTQPACIAAWCVVLAVGLGAADIKSLRREQRRWIWLIVMVVAAYVAVLLAQSMPPAATGLSPHPVWAKASALLQRPLPASVSIVSGQPLFAIGAPVAALSAGFLGYLVGADRLRAKRLLDVVAWSGAGLALFAIASFLIDPAKLFWWNKAAYAGVLTTPFVNRNAAALYYGVCSVVGALQFWQVVRPRLPSGPLRPTALVEALPSLPPFQTLMRAVAPVLCLIALLLTASRAGTVLALAGQVMAFTVFFWRDLPRKIGPVAALALGGLIALIVLQTLGGSAGNRFNEHGLVDAGRIDTYRATIRLISDSPWLGVGLGGFPFAFPAYRTGSVWGVWDRAHNVLLEIAAEGGVPLAIIIAVAWLLVIGLLIRGIRQRRRDIVFPAAGLTVAAMALVHAMIDFSLQIPGFAIPAMTVVGVGAAQSFATRRISNSGAVAEQGPL